MPPHHKPLYRDLALCAGLILITVIAYWGIWNAQFVYYDDPDYIQNNLHMRHGLTWDNVVWAFTSGEQANWHPLTWLSHLLDAQLYGISNAAGHHVTALLLHASNAVLLFLLFRVMTGAAWRSAVVAALFAIHPAHVESVAWVSERKDVLSVFLGLWCLLAYVWYSRRPGVGRYLLVVLLFALGLMAKPMLMTLPFVLLLLDYWPLGRTQPKWLALEKLPLVLLAIASGVVTYEAQQRGGGVAADEVVSLFARLKNVPVNYVGYLETIFWPARLAHLYPYAPAGILAAALALLLLLIVTVAVVWGARRGRRYLAVGWFWYLGTLVPVIGFLQVGSHKIADRYTYLPSIGIFLLVVWGAAELLAFWRHRLVVLAPAAGIIVVVCMTLTLFQSRCWFSSEALHRHTLAVTTDNAVTANDLANVLAMRAQELAPQGRSVEAKRLREEAIRYYQEALRVQPNFADAHNNLGNVLSDLGQIEESIRHYEFALKVNPQYAVAHYNLGNRLFALKRYDEAIAHYRQALELKTGYVDACIALGNVSLTLGRADDAVKAYQEALRFNPEHPIAYYDMATIFNMAGRPSEALGYCRQSVQYAPGDPQPVNLFVRIEAGAADPAVHNTPQEIQLAEQICQATQRRNPLYIDTLAMAYADAGRFAEAVAAAREAVALANSYGMADLAAEIQSRQRLYEAGKPYRTLPQPK
jgi:tetratricopeptide (TPR) repeat protein